MSCSPTLSLSVHLHTDLPLFVCFCGCACVCVGVCERERVCLHVLYALSACSQLIKTQCQLSCFLPACLPGVCSFRHRPPLLYLISLHLPSPPSPSLSCYSTPIISLVFALDTLLALHPLHTLLRSASLLLISKLQTSRWSDNTQSVTCFVSRGTFWLGDQSQPENRLSQT